MRRTIGILLVFMLCVTLLAGCGGGGDNGGLSGKYGFFPKIVDIGLKM